MAGNLTWVKEWKSNTILFLLVYNFPSNWYDLPCQNLADTMCLAVKCRIMWLTLVVAVACRLSPTLWLVTCTARWGVSSRGHAPNTRHVTNWPCIEKNITMTTCACKKITRKSPRMRWEQNRDQCDWTVRIYGTHANMVSLWWGLYSWNLYYSSLIYKCSIYLHLNVRKLYHLVLKLR